ncbi:MAG: lysophospholipid acyltransferase family protein [Haloechinothrix sp.]
MAGREKGGFWVAVAAVLFYPLSWLARQVYRGVDRIPPEGGALLAFNHVSHLDPVTDAVFVHRQKRVPRFMAKDSVLKIPLLGKILKESGGIPVYRGKSSAGESLKDAHKALRTGKVVVIYPEGTITRDPEGRLKNTYTGVARLALQNDVPVIPIARWGTNHILDGYRRKFRPLPRKRVTFHVGEPIDLAAYRTVPQTSAVLREVTDLIMAEVASLLAEIRDERPPENKNSVQADGA